MFAIGFTLGGRVFRLAYTAPALGGLQYAPFNPEKGLFPVPTLLLETVVVSVKHGGNRCHLLREKRQTQFGVALLNHASQQTRCGNPTGRPVNCAAIASNLLLMTSRALMLGKQPGAQRKVGADIQGRHLRPCRHQDQQQRTERNKFIHRCVQRSRMEWRSIVVRATVPRKRVVRGSSSFIPVTLPSWFYTASRTGYPGHAGTSRWFPFHRKGACWRRRKRWKAHVSITKLAPVSTYRKEVENDVINRLRRIRLSPTWTGPLPYWRGLVSRSGLGSALPKGVGQHQPGEKRVWLDAPFDHTCSQPRDKRTSAVCPPAPAVRHNGRSWHRA